MKYKNQTDVAVIGGGPAGMAAAWAAERCGAHVMLLERSSYLGGVLPQCVHDGFGLYTEGESLPGPRYAQIWKDKLKETQTVIMLDTMVTQVSPDQADSVLISCTGPALGGPAEIRAKRMILATGCRERSRGQLRIPGTRPAGIMTAGCAQYMMNIRNRLPGDKVVILGSGDIGLIMARRLKLEGAEVRMVLGQEATGLYRNHVQCIKEMNIPFRYGWTVLSVHGRGRLKGVMIAPLGSDGIPVYNQREYIRCNTLLIAAGLIPERDTDGLDKVMDKGDLCYLAGNADHIHDLVDGAVIQGVRCGIAAASGSVRDISVPEEVSRIAETESLNETGVCEEVSRQGTEEVLESGILHERCTGCPSSCMLELVMDRGEILEVRGAGCEKGPDMIRRQIRDPERVFTGTVKVAGTVGDSVLLPVYTSGAVPVAELMHLARICRRMTVTAPVRTGQVIRKNIAGLGVDLLSSCER